MLCIYMLLLLSGQIFLLFMASVVGGYFRPSITLRPPSGEVLQGQNFTIICHPPYPGGYTQLEFNGLTIASPSSVLHDATTFPFEAANSSHSGNYSCAHVTIYPFGISRSNIVIVKVREIGQKSESLLVPIVAGSAAGAASLLLLILLGVCITRRSGTHMESYTSQGRPRLVTHSIYRSHPLERDDRDSECDNMETPSVGSGDTYMKMQSLEKGCTYADTPSEGSNVSYIDVEIPEEEESECEHDYVNTMTLKKESAPVGYGDSDSEPDYENSAFLCGAAK